MENFQIDFFYSTISTIDLYIIVVFDWGLNWKIGVIWFCENVVEMIIFSFILTIKYSLENQNSRHSSIVCIFIFHYLTMF